MIANTNDNIRLDQICIKYQFGLELSTSPPPLLLPAVAAIVISVSLLSGILRQNKNWCSSVGSEGAVR